MSEPTSGADVLRRIQPRRRVEETSICMRPDLVAALARADAELAEMRAESGTSNRLNGGTPNTPEMREKAEEVRRIEEEIVASQVTFRFESVSKDVFRAMQDNCPPRKGDQLDNMVGYNRDAVLDTLVRVCLIEPVFEECLTEDGQPNRECQHDGCGTWQQFLKLVNPGEWGELRDTANEANNAVVDPPKSVLASQILDPRANASS